MDSYEALIITAGGVLVALLGICCKTCYKIKISELSLCWNAVVVKRDVEDEIREEQDRERQTSFHSRSTKTPRVDFNTRI